MSLMSLLQGNFDTHRVLPRAQAMNKANAFLKITCWSKSEQFDQAVADFTTDCHPILKR
jgi:hypothetical protein